MFGFNVAIQVACLASRAVLTGQRNVSPKLIFTGSGGGIGSCSAWAAVEVAPRAAREHARV